MNHANRSHSRPSLSATAAAWLRPASAVVGLVVLALLLLQVALMHYGRDQSIYATVATVMRDGGAPYKDAWDFKPPGIFFVYVTSQLVLGTSMHAVRILEALALLSMVGAFIILARRARLGAVAGLWAGVVAVFFHVALDFWHTAQPESFGGPLIAWALVLATYEAAPGDARAHPRAVAAWVGCAALFALAFILKPPLGGGIVVAFALVAARERGRDGGSVAAAALSFLFGAVLVIGATLGYVVASGAWPYLREIFFTYVPRYTEIQFSWSALPGLFVRVFEKWPAGAHPFVWLGVAALLVRSWHRRPGDGVLLLILCTALIQVFGIALQAKFFPYHYGALLPLAAFLAVWGYATLWRGRLRWAMLVVVALGAHYAWTQVDLRARSRERWAALTHAEARDRINDRLYTIYDVNAGANRAAAGWIAANTSPDEPIFVWGFEPGIYAASGRRPASRYIYNIAQRTDGAWEDARRELMEDLRVHKPSVIVVVRRDALPHVTGNPLTSAAAVRTFPELRSLIADQYEPAGTIEDLVLYRRTDAARAPMPVPPDRRHVLLVTFDTLRHDYLSSQGYDLPTTPTIDALARNATVFTRALTPIPRTTQALASMLTGRYPHGTRVRTLVDSLPADVPTLPALARGNGYRTVAVVSNHILTRERRLDRGFDTYDTASDARTAKETTAAAKHALSGLGPDDPVFLWVHYIDPHVPYYPERATVESFTPGYAGRYRYHFGDVRGGTGNAAYPRDLSKREAVFDNQLPDDVNAHVRRLYAADIRDTDDALGELLLWLQGHFGDNWTIVFTSDHGESLGEHDYYYDHGDYVYDASARVPMLITLPPGHPDRGQRVVDDWVSLIDVTPTLVDLLGFDVPPSVSDAFDGRSLVPAMQGEAQPERTLFAECGHSYFPDMVPTRKRFDVAGRFRAAWRGDWKLIWTPFQTGSMEYQLYNVRLDPHETDDASQRESERVTDMALSVEDWARFSGAEGPTPPLSEEERARLRSLGYIGD